MIEHEPWPTSITKIQKLFIRKKLFFLVYIIKGVYIVFATVLPV